MLGFEDQEQHSARCWLFSNGLDVTRVEGEPIARSPLTVGLGDGVAVVYRYGAVVLFGVADADARRFIEQLRSGAQAPDQDPDVADLHRAAGGAKEGIQGTGALVLKNFDVSRLRVVAEALARSALLTYYESYLGRVLSDLEPATLRLREHGRLPARTRALLRGVGDVLHTEMRMIGRAEVSEKSDFVWDEPELDRLYAKLAEEYELGDRDLALSRKLDLALRSISILIDALGARRALHVEWAIFLLILIEVVVAF
jgi:uncharacterized Rmd1/YagE family protein